MAIGSSKNRNGNVAAGARHDERPRSDLLRATAILCVLAVAIFALGWFVFGKIFDNTALHFLFAAFQCFAIGMLADVVNVRRSRSPS